MAARGRLGGSRHERLGDGCDHGRHRFPDPDVRFLTTNHRRGDRPLRRGDPIRRSSSSGRRVRPARARLSPLRLDMCSPRWLSGLYGRGALCAVRVRVTGRRGRGSLFARARGVTVSLPSRVLSCERVLDLGPMDVRGAGGQNDGTRQGRDTLATSATSPASPSWRSPSSDTPASARQQGLY